MLYRLVKSLESEGSDFAVENFKRSPFLDGSVERSGDLKMEQDGSAGVLNFPDSDDQF